MKFTWGTGLDSYTQYVPGDEPYDAVTGLSRLAFELGDNEYARRSWDNWVWSWSMTLMPGPLCLVSGI